MNRALIIITLIFLMTIFTGEIMRPRGVSASNSYSPKSSLAPACHMAGRSGEQAETISSKRLPLSPTQPQKTVESKPKVKDTEPFVDLLVQAIIQVESDGRTRLVGPKGERGLMQIPRYTWNWICRRHLKVKWDYDRWAFDREKNIVVGRAELTYLLKRLDNDWEAAVMAYNCGYSRYKSGRTPRMTYRYLRKVKSELKRLSTI